jgi:tRNA threonylcarbamoyladenosine modification (KEOPS) complex Cgi121 subunit
MNQQVNFERCKRKANQFRAKQGTCGTVHQRNLQGRAMTKKTEEPNENITIAGFRNVQIEDVNAFLEHFRTEKMEASVQFFDAKHVAGPQHLYFAALNALNAFEKNTNISNNLTVEALLYASAQRQIKKAVKTLGIKQGSSEVAALIITENRHKKSDYLRLVTKTVPGERDDSTLELTDKKIVDIKKLFGISDLEFEAKLEKEGLEKEALTDLVIERMALLGTKS